jgi:hypothetical protein
LPPSFIYDGAHDQDYDTANALDDGFRDVYILSIPSFTWFSAGKTIDKRRVTTACEIIGNRQLLVLGGSDPTVSPKAQKYATDPWIRGMKIFDLTALEWTQNYNGVEDKAPVPAPTST